MDDDEDDKPFNELTPAEAERLALLAEELGEAVQAIGKVLRHGYQSWSPFKPKVLNRESLERELGHVRAAVQIMEETGDISAERVNGYRHDKRMTVSEWLHEQNVSRPRGVAP